MPYNSKEIYLLDVYPSTGHVSQDQDLVPELILEVLSHPDKNGAVKP